MSYERMVCILDYGSGNVRSVYNMVRNLGFKTEISREKKVIKDASHLILPGVGSFKSAMTKMNQALPMTLIEDVVVKGGKPFLGICVGMQVLADVGYEFEQHAGLGWISGSVRKLDVKGLSLPHVGWNDIVIRDSHAIFSGLKEHRDFYFVHSYCFEASNTTNSIATTIYDESFTSVICKDNIFGFQFHPEKSQKAGQLLMKNFVAKL